MAFFVITLSKLAVLNPEMIVGWQGKRLGKAETCGRIKNLLSFYRGVDDDALLCRVATEKWGCPTWIGGDFRARWGCKGKWAIKHELPKYIPPAVKPTKVDVEEMFNHLAGKVPLLVRVPEPSWSPVQPLQGYELAIDAVDTTHHKGLGEMIYDMVTPKVLKMNLGEAAGKGYQGGSWFAVGEDLEARLPKDWRDRVKKVVPKATFEVRGLGNHIFSNELVREDNRKAMRRVLLSGVFPIWRLNDCGPDTYEKWMAQVGVVVVKKAVGKEVWKYERKA